MIFSAVMLRYGLFGLFLAAGYVTGAVAACRGSDPSEIVIERRTVPIAAGQFEAVSFARKGDGPLGFVSSGAALYAPDCRIMYEQQFKDATATRFTLAQLGHERLLILTTFYPGGSGCGYDHALLILGDERDNVSVLAPMNLSHSNMDGFYVGNLGDRRGAGLVLWRAVWGRDEVHYSDHRYEIVNYRWSNREFRGPTVITTQQKFAPSPDDVARSLGFSFRDLTEPKRFGGC